MTFSFTPQSPIELLKSAIARNGSDSQELANEKVELEHRISAIERDEAVLTTVRTAYDAALATLTAPIPLDVPAETPDATVTSTVDETALSFVPTAEPIADPIIEPVVETPDTKTTAKATKPTA
ncbi:hypothetical protein [Subtercola sp. RTI3]|uniref:hypothetical protein n=1 Tax=Subtercola sp. RTI3 TaxID=3048639 RepID=UPI002B22B82A|nr:hypothetical protein [Subtercola sp. RTI3]MEA9983660.1 hypothetical protein [Subtercola sp. RTI3]